MLLDELRTIDRIMGETAPDDDDDNKETTKMTNGDGELPVVGADAEVGVTAATAIRTD